jgi:7-cyano-7-deazaguanine tRNA-ribosyltransferase
MEVVQGETQWLEKSEPISKKRAFFYTGRYSLNRPLVYRYHQRLFQRYIPPAKKIRVVPEEKKPYSRYYQKYVTTNATILISSPFGPVPLELDEMYPFSQSLFPQKLDVETQEMSKRLEQQFLDHLEKLVGHLKISSTKERIDKKMYQLRKIKKVADMQFGLGAGDALFDGEIDILVSPRTGKIRSIYVDEKLIASMRASDGFFILGKEGGHRLHKKLDFPDMRVIIDNEAIPFVQQGRNVFSKFVIDASDRVRPLDEVLIVSAKDDLVGTGTCLLNREELLSFTTGMGVKTRHGYIPPKKKSK